RSSPFCSKMISARLYARGTVRPVWSLTAVGRNYVQSLFFFLRGLLRQPPPRIAVEPSPSTRNPAPFLREDSKRIPLHDALSQIRQRRVQSGRRPFRTKLPLGLPRIAPAQRRPRQPPNRRRRPGSASPAFATCPLPPGRQPGG